MLGPQQLRLKPTPNGRTASLGMCGRFAFCHRLEWFSNTWLMGLFDDALSEGDVLYRGRRSGGCIQWVIHPGG